MCLAHAVTVPERFKGGTCSFGAPAAQTYGWELSRADSNGRYAVGAHIIARRTAASQGTLLVTDLWHYAHEAPTVAHYLLFTYNGDGTTEPTGRTITVNRTSAYAADTGIAVPAPASARTRRGGAERPAPVVRDLRDRAGRTPHALLFAPATSSSSPGCPAAASPR